MPPLLNPQILARLPEELDENASKIAALATMLQWTLHLYTVYYVQLLHEAVQSNSDTHGMVGRLQSELSEMEILTQSLSSLLRTLGKHCPGLQRILNSDDYQEYYHREAGKFFL